MDIPIQIVSVALGGCLALLGSLITAFVSLTLARRRDVYTLRRDKIEEIYTLVQKVPGSHIRLVQSLLKTEDGDEDPKGEDQPSIGRIEMLVKFYQPSLIPEVTQLSKASTKHLDLCFEYIKEYHETGTRPTPERAEELLFAPGRDVADKAWEMLHKIERIFKP